MNARTTRVRTEEPAKINLVATAAVLQQDGPARPASKVTILKKNLRVS